MRPTEVLRLTGRQLDPDSLEAWCEYVRGFNVDPSRVRDKLVITHDSDGYHLHLSLKTNDPSGNGDWLDLAIEDVVSTPLIIDLGTERTWPTETGWIHHSLGGHELVNG